MRGPVENPTGPHFGQFNQLRPPGSCAGDPKLVGSVVVDVTGAGALVRRSVGVRIVLEDGTGSAGGGSSDGSTKPLFDACCAGGDGVFTEAGNSSGDRTGGLLVGLTAGTWFASVGSGTLTG